MADLREILRDSFLNKPNGGTTLLESFTKRVKDLSDFKSGILNLRRGNSEWVIISKGADLVFRRREAEGTQL